MSLFSVTAAGETAAAAPGRGGAGRVDVVAEHGVAAGDDPAGYPAAHVPEADEADLAFGVTRTPRTNLGSFAIGFALGFVSHAIRTPSPSASDRKAAHHLRVVTDQQRRAPPSCQLADGGVARVHRAKVDHDLERPLELELLVVVNGVGGDDGRAAGGLHDQHRLAGRMPSDADRLDPGSDLRVAVEQPEAAVGDPLDLLRLDQRRELLVPSLWTRPELELPALDDQLRVREPLQVPGVVVVEMSEDHCRHGLGLDPDPPQRFVRRAEAGAAAAGAGRRGGSRCRPRSSSRRSGPPRRSSPSRSRRRAPRTSSSGSSTRFSGFSGFRTGARPPRTRTDSTRRRL